MPWPNSDTQFKHGYSTPQQAGSVAPFLENLCNFRCLAEGVPRPSGFATVMPALSPYTHGLSAKPAWVPVFLLRGERQGRSAKG